MSVSWIYEFLLMIHMTFFKNNTISDEFDQEKHEVSIRHNMWTYVQQLEKMIHNCLNTHSFQSESWIHSQSWLVQSCSERCAFAIWQK